MMLGFLAFLITLAYGAFLVSSSVILFLWIVGRLKQRKRYQYLAYDAAPTPPEYVAGLEPTPATTPGQEVAPRRLSFSAITPNSARPRRVTFNLTPEQQQRDAAKAPESSQAAWSYSPVPVQANGPVRAVLRSRPSAPAPAPQQPLIELFPGSEQRCTGSGRSQPTSPRARGNIRKRRKSQAFPSGKELVQADLGIRRTESAPDTVTQYAPPTIAEQQQGPMIKKRAAAPGAVANRQRRVPARDAWKGSTSPRQITKRRVVARKPVLMLSAASMMEAWERNRAILSQDANAGRPRTQLLAQQDIATGSRLPGSAAPTATSVFVSAPVTQSATLGAVPIANPALPSFGSGLESSSQPNAFATGLPASQMSNKHIHFSPDGLEVFGGSIDQGRSGSSSGARRKLSSASAKRRLKRR